MCDDLLLNAVKLRKYILETYKSSQVDITIAQSYTCNKENGTKRDKIKNKKIKK